MHIEQKVNLQPYNTFHLECRADHFVEIKTIDDLHELIDTQVFKDSERLILWWGSNILLTQDHFDWLVIKNSISWKEILEEDASSITIQVWAGENRNDFVRRSIDQWYCGIENLVSIPGAVGAAPMQNIGAYGGEVKSVIQNVHCVRIGPPDTRWTPLEAGERVPWGEGVDTTDWKEVVEGGLLKLNNDQCSFSYRSSIFKTDLKDKVFITHVTFKLDKYTPTTYEPTISYGAIRDKLAECSPKGELSEGLRGVTPEDIAKVVASIRSAKLPDRTQIGTAGSFFKNPIVSQAIFDKLQIQFPELRWFPTDSPLVTRWMTKSENVPWGKGGPGGICEPDSRCIKLSAWQLIDLAGLKWLTQWQVGTYKNHALVLVNHGWGTGKELTDLAKHIQDTVYNAFGIILEPEVNYV